MKELPARARAYLVATWLLAALALALSALANPNWLLIGALSGLTVIIDRARPGLRMQGQALIGLHMTLPMAVAAGLLGGPAEACFVGALSAFAGGRRLPTSGCSTARSSPCPRRGRDSCSAGWARPTCSSPRRRRTPQPG